MHANILYNSALLRTTHFISFFLLSVLAVFGLNAIIISLVYNNNDNDIES